MKHIQSPNVWPPNRRNTRTRISKSQPDIRQNLGHDSAYHSSSSADDERRKTLVGRTSFAQGETKPLSNPPSLEMEELNCLGTENPITSMANEVDPTSSKTMEAVAHHLARIKPEVAKTAVSKHEMTTYSAADNTTSAAMVHRTTDAYKACTKTLLILFSAFTSFFVILYKLSNGLFQKSYHLVKKWQRGMPSKKPGSDAPKIGGVTSSSKVTHETEELDMEEDGPPPDVLYRTMLDIPDEDEWRNFYSGKPFPEWADPWKKETKRSKSRSKVEMVRKVAGSWRGDFKKTPLDSMEEHQWRMNNLHVDFKKHVRIEKQGHPGMFIYDSVFLEIMKSLIKYYPSGNLTGDEIYIEYPWKMLMHYYKEIVSLRNELRDSEATSRDIYKTDRGLAKSKKVHSIDQILELIKGTYDTIVHPEIENHTKSRVAEFGKLWLLFRPGEEVFATVHGKTAAFIVLAYNDHEPGESATTHAPIKQFIVHVWNLRLVAGSLVRHMSKIAIDKYEGTRLIEKLPVYPCKYEPKVRQKLIERGRRFFKMIQKPHAYMKYTGLTQDENPRPVSPPMWSEY